MTSKYYVVIFGSKDAKTPPPMDGEEHVFETQAELNAWLTVHGVRLHEKVDLARNSVFQMPDPDNRAVKIYFGRPRVTKVKIVVV